MLAYQAPTATNSSLSTPYPCVLVLPGPALRYRVATSALTILLQFVERFLDGSSDGGPEVRERTALYARRFDLYGCLQPLAFGAKKDQVVKELALQCLSSLIARAGDALGRGVVVSTLEEATKRLRSEVLRTSVLQTLQRIAQTELQLGVDAEIATLVHDLFDLLRQNDRKVRRSRLVGMHGFPLS